MQCSPGGQETKWNVVQGGKRPVKMSRQRVAEVPKEREGPERGRRVKPVKCATLMKCHDTLAVPLSSVDSYPAPRCHSDKEDVAVISGRAQPSVAESLN